MLAALPASPVQLAHACRALGFDVAFPASWGDELVAASCLESLAERGAEPVVLCACPYVSDRLTRSGSELTPWLLRTAPPPVAVARYLRAAYGSRAVHITYVGACPSASDPAIDARLSPEELIEALAARGIVLAEQPDLFESVLPPDRRRYYSLPGGAPHPDRLVEVDPERELVELVGEDFLLELAQHLIARRRVLIDIAPQLGCACSGVVAAGAASAARPALVALEPPRAPGPVLDASVASGVTLEWSHDCAAAAAVPREEPASSGGAAGATADAREAPTAPPGEPPRVVIREHAAREPARRPPAIVWRRGVGAPPAVRRGDGAVVPRAFAGRARRPERHAPEPPAAPERRPLLERIDGTSDARRTRRGSRRPLVIPMPNEPRPVPPPPPPSKHGPRALFDLAAIVGAGHD
ncbi:MAG TPA: [Fe-Fe] hydrogenase large subunit C-terminal domain-containing protein [Gemmatimonadaceae bacterium]